MTKIRFEDLPSTNTPINAENLNKLTNVIVSSEEPTTGEEVWLQKGKNFVRDALYGHVNGNTGIIDTDTNWFHSQLINVKSGTPYTFSLNTTNSHQQWLWAYYQEDGTFISMDYGDFGTGNSSITKLMPSNCSKVYVGWFASANASNVQLEQGETVTTYEPYIIKKIHTKTDNGYEEFYNEEEREVYSTCEKKKGTWFDG